MIPAHTWAVLLLLGYFVSSSPRRTRRELVADLRSGAPPGRATLTSDEVGRLRAATASLLGASSDLLGEYETFVARVDRVLSIPDHILYGEVTGAVVLVTGGTGCIGTALLKELALQSPARLVSLSRGRRYPAEVLPSVEYINADIRDRSALNGVFSRTSPDLVFHLAAQRDPGLAERAVVSSLSTNVAGTRNVLEACWQCGVGSFVYASTGKALRPYTPHIYAASKKFGEYLTLMASRRDRVGRYSIARFTHVVDNSLVLRRFVEMERMGVLGLHDSKTVFYTQSAAEAAHLLLCALQQSQLGRPVEVLAIRDLGLPTSLLDLALGVVARGNGRSALYIRGDEPGYEDSYYPGLYDPETAADVSPLLNAFEATDAHAISYADVDASPVRLDLAENIDDAIRKVETVCLNAEESQARNAVRDASFGLLAATIASAEPSVLRRLAHLTFPLRPTMSEVDLVIDDTIRAFLSFETRELDHRRVASRALGSFFTAH